LRDARPCVLFSDTRFMTARRRLPPCDASKFEPVHILVWFPRKVQHHSRGRSVEASREQTDTETTGEGMSGL